MLPSWSLCSHCSTSSLPLLLPLPHNPRATSFLPSNPLHTLCVNLLSVPSSFALLISFLLPPTILWVECYHLILQMIGELRFREGEYLAQDETESKFNSNIPVPSSTHPCMGKWSAWGGWRERETHAFLLTSSSALNWDRDEVPVVTWAFLRGLEVSRVYDGWMVR